MNAAEIRVQISEANAKLGGLATRIARAYTAQDNAKDEADKANAKSAIESLEFEKSLVQGALNGLNLDLKDAEAEENAAQEAPPEEGAQ